MNNYPAEIPKLVLGTAMWGWTMPPKRCFEVLDTFYQHGFRAIDGATNYPINKQPDDFRRAEQILQEWIRANQITDLEVMMKIGSINNLRSPEHNLTYSFMMMCLDEYRFKLGDNLNMLMVHWDNRDTPAEIEDSFRALKHANEKGLDVGLSGIRHPELYAKINRQYQLDFQIQIKHNLLHSDYQRYAAFHGKRRFITYGINAGGLKLDVKAYEQDSSLKVRGGNIAQPPPMLEKLKVVIEAENKKKARSPITNFNECGLTYAFHSPDIAAILLGTSNKQQLQESIRFYQSLQTGVRTDFYEKLRGLVRRET